MKLQKNVPSNPLQDVKWSLSCTDGCVKAVADAVKRLQIRMDKRVKLQKNVPSNPLQDVKWSLSCTDGCVKAVADAVKRLQIRMDYLEERMSEISSLKEFVWNKKKEEEDANIPCLLYESKRRKRKLEENGVPDKKE